MGQLARVADAERVPGGQAEPMDDGRDTLGVAIELQRIERHHIQHAGDGLIIRLDEQANAAGSTLVAALGPA